MDNLTFKTSKYIHFDVRGIGFKSEIDDVKKLPLESQFLTDVQLQHKVHSTPIAQVDDRTKLLDDVKEPIYLKRNSVLFESILDYIEQGFLHFPHNYCIEVISKELDYWGLDIDHLSPCCLDRYVKYVDRVNTIQEIRDQWYSIQDRSRATSLDITVNYAMPKKSPKTVHSNGLAVDDNGRKGSGGGSGHYHWKHSASFFISEHAPVLSKVWPVITTFIIVTSIAVIFIDCEEFGRSPSYSSVLANANLTNSTGMYYQYLQHSFPKAWSVLLDMTCNIILTADLTMRLVLNSNRARFLKQFLTVVDILCVVSVWIYNVWFLVIILCGWTLMTLFEKSEAFYYFIICSIALRLLRVLRLGHILFEYRSLKIIILGLKRCWRDLIIVWMLLCILSTIFGLLLFAVEFKTDNIFGIFPAFWWAMITITTVGYGDVHPVTYGGYIVGILCSAFGTMLVAMSTTILINSFRQIYRNVEQIERAQKFSIGL